MMKIQTIHSSLSTLKSDVAVVFFYEDEDLFLEQKIAIVADFPTTDLVLSSGDFKGKRKSGTVVYTGNKSLPRLLLVGIGKSTELTLEFLRRASAFSAKQALAIKAESIAFPLVSISETSPSDIAQATIEGAILSQYKFDKYLTENSNTKKTIGKITLWTNDKTLVAGAKAGSEFAQILCEGVTITRDLANAPNNEIYPETLGKQAEIAGKAAGFEVNVLNKKKIQCACLGAVFNLPMSTVTIIEDLLMVAMAIISLII